MTLLEGMILIVTVVWMLQRFRIKDLKLKQSFNFNLLSFNLPLLFFLFSATISLFVAPDLRAAAGIWKAYFVEPILFFLVLSTLLKTRQLQRTHIIAALGVSLLIPALFAIYQQFTGAFIANPFWAAEATRRVTSFYGFPNAIGLYFAPVILLLIGAALYSKSKNKFYILTALLALAAIIFAQSKGALAGILVGLIFFAVFAKGYRRIFTSIIIAALIAAALSPQLRTFTGSRTVSGGGSLEVRTQQWTETWKMLKTRPILGAGLSGYQTRVAPFHQKKYIEIFMYPHTIMLNFWSEIGLLGLFAFAWLIFAFFRTTFPSLKIREGRVGYESITIAATAAMITLLVHGLVDVPYFKNDLAILFWVIYALPFAQPLITET